jgi:hypothetical protein
MLRFLRLQTVFVAALVAFPAFAQEKKEVWTDPNDPSLPKDFQIQGEYAGQSADGKGIGCQIIALGDGKFQAVILPGGGRRKQEPLGRPAGGRESRV